MNGGVYSTGNEIVDENAKLNISGNIILQILLERYAYSEIGGTFILV